MKLIAPILKRAAELDRARPKIAYYCRLYAVMSGLRMENRSPEVNEMMSDAMEKLERAKATMKDLDEVQDEVTCESFALEIFDKADRADRAGSRGITTAKMYYAASIFFNVLRQFDEDGELEGTIAQKQKYAEWRAAEIMKAERQGVQASAPPEDDVDQRVGGVDTAFSGTEEPTASAPELRMPPPPPPPPQRMVASTSTGPPVGITSKPVVTPRAPTAPVPSGAPPGVCPPAIDIGSIADAHRHAKNAVSALGFDDVHTAVDSLTRALEILKPLAKK